MGIQSERYQGNYVFITEESLLRPTAHIILGIPKTQVFECNLCTDNNPKMYRPMYFFS